MKQAIVKHAIIAGGLVVAVLATSADAVVVCERVNRRGVVKKALLRPGTTCRSSRERPVLQLGDGAGSAAPGVVGLGSIIAHTTHLPGSATVEEMRALGFAVCDGSTPGAQGIGDAVLNDPTPDLNGPGLFLRGSGGPSGVVQEDATAVNDLQIQDDGHAHQSPVGYFCGTGTGPTINRAFWDEVCAGDLVPNVPASSNVSLVADAEETRPANMSVVWLIRVR